MIGMIRVGIGCVPRASARWRGKKPDRPDDRGSLALEFAFAAPMLFLLLALVYAFGRVAQVDSAMDAGVRDAARSATQARTGADAKTRATSAMTAAMTDSPTCAPLAITLSSDTLIAGTDLTVTASCTYSLADLGLPGLGSIHRSVSFTSRIDPNRGVDGGS